MIHLAVEHIVNELNNYLSVKISETSKVVHNSLVKPDGSVQAGIDDKIVVSLVNIEEERIARDPEIYKKQLDGTIHIIKPEVKLNLYLLITAYFPSDYNEALKMLSLIIGFFQKKNTFNTSNSPGLDPRIKDMNLGLYTLNMEQQNHLWGSIGAKYLPSVLYKMRLISIAEDEIDGTGEPVTEIHINEDKP
jgi:hypothetical protein